MNTVSERNSLLCQGLTLSAFLLTGSCHLPHSLPHSQIFMETLEMLGPELGPGNLLENKADGLSHELRAWTWNLLPYKSQGQKEVSSICLPGAVCPTSPPYSQGISVLLLLSFLASFVWLCLCVCVLSHVQLCGLMDCSLPGSSVHGISQARILEWVAISSPRGSSRLVWLHRNNE